MRLLVTGIGIVSPLAFGTEATWHAVLAGRRAFGAPSLFRLQGCGVDLAAEVPGADASAIAGRALPPSWSRTDAMAWRAAREALEQARLTPAGDVDLVVGGTTAGLFETEEILAKVTRDPASAEPLERMRSHPLSATADRLDESLGPFMRTRTLCSACSGGATALVLAAVALASGRAKRVLAGGADGLCRLTYAGFAALGALDPEPCKPFDRHRRGLNLGEAAAFLVLETDASAAERGVTPIAELVGWAMASEAYHETHPEPDGKTAAWTMRRAIELSGLTPEHIGYLNAHGTATPYNDSMEATAIVQCFGGHAAGLPVSSSKGHFGHTLGAAGAIEAAISALAVARGALPPSVGLEDVDPACEGLDHVMAAREASIDAAASNSFGFGGNDTTVVLARPGLAPERTPLRARRIVITGGGSVGPLGLTGSKGARPYASAAASVGDSLRAQARIPPSMTVDAAVLGIDPMRARRFARGARMVTAAIGRALDEAALMTNMGASRAGRGHPVGAIVGAAFGAPSGTGEFLMRLMERGARFASPAAFPYVLPSALATCPSIYHRLLGPSFSVADLSTSAECAVAIAAELVAAGEVAAMVAASVEEKSLVAERITGPMLSAIANNGTRGEGATAFVLESAEFAARRGAPVRAELVLARSWRGTGTDWQGDFPGPSGRAGVFRARPSDVTAPGAWAHCVPRLSSVVAGDHEGAGGFALLAAVAALDARDLDSALVLGSAPARGYALLLVAPSRRTFQRPTDRSGVGD